MIFSFSFLTFFYCNNYTISAGKFHQSDYGRLTRISHLRKEFILENARIGISSACFYPMDTEEAFKRCVSLGFKNIELFTCSFSELEEPFLTRIKEIADDNGVKIPAVHPFTSGFEYLLFFSSYKKRTEESAEVYRKYFHAANTVGADFVVFHGDRLTAPFLGMENYCEAFSSLRDTAKSDGITLAHECVSTGRSGNPEFIRELHTAIGEGNIKFVFDLKQVVRGGYNPDDMLDAMGSDIVHVHINDYANNKCRLPYAGELELDKIIGRIESSGYRGKYIIEVYGDNYKEDSEIIRAADILRSKNYCHN